MALEKLSKDFSIQGAISEAQLDAAKESDSIYEQANLKQLSKKPRKDERIVTQQRMVLITPDALKYLESIKGKKNGKRACQVREEGHYRDTKGGNQKIGR